jgi:hypothetical protein
VRFEDDGDADAPGPAAGGARPPQDGVRLGARDERGKGFLERDELGDVALALAEALEERGEVAFVLVHLDGIEGVEVGVLEGVGAVRGDADRFDGRE